MAFSPVGRKKVTAHFFVLLVNIIVLALAAKVNQFQEFYYVADLFPLALSIVTLVLLTFMLALDFVLNNASTGKPQIEIGVFSVLSIFWLSFNAFSSSRWMAVPMSCGDIPAEFDDVVGWCKDLNALKAFVWIVFLAIFFTTVFTAHYAISQSNQGKKHIWKGPLSRYDPNAHANNTLSWGNAYPTSATSNYPFQGQNSVESAGVPSAGADANYYYTNDAQLAQPEMAQTAGADYYNGQNAYYNNNNAAGYYNGQAQTAGVEYYNGQNVDGNYYNGAANNQYNEKAY